MTLPRPLPFALPLLGVLLHAIGFAGPALAGDIPKDKAAFTAYMQNKLQLYSPSPINVVGPLRLSVGTANAAVALPSLKTLHKRCIAAPATCEHAVNDYVQDVARAIQTPPAAEPTVASNETQSSDATIKPTCMPANAPNANTRDKCTPPIVDLQHSRTNFTPSETCGWIGNSKIEGVVIVSYVVRADGSASNVTIEASSDFSALDDAALSMVNTKHYLPGTRNGKPVDYAMKSLFLFSCSGKILAPQPMTTPSQAAPPSSPGSTEKPTCMPADAPNANTHDKCTPPHIDWNHSPQVIYPLEAARAGETGAVMVGLTVHVDGSVSDVTVLQSSGFSRLDDAATTQAAGRHYFPATKNGTPVDMQTKSMIRFDMGAPAYISERSPAVSERELPGFPRSGAP
jgi:TonB family protein